MTNTLFARGICSLAAVLTIAAGALGGHPRR